jgi:hypothetical protein
MVVVMYRGSKGSYSVRLRLSLLLFQLRIGVKILLLLDLAEADFVTVWCFCFAMMLLQHTDFGELPRWAVDAGYRCLFPFGLTGLVLQ